MERANGTLQDRLVKELRLANISDIEQANRWLQDSRFFQEISRRFGVQAVDGVDAHRPLVMDLTQVLCTKEKRCVSRDGCIHWHGQTLQLNNARASLKEVDVWQQLDGSLVINDGGRRLSVGIWTPPPRVRPVFKNNAVYKPGRRQQIHLPGSKPQRPRQPQEALW